MKYKLFVAHSFDERDKEIVDWIINRLRKDFEIVTGKQPEAKTLTEKIFPRINECDVFCGIFTKRYSNDKGEWVASPWIYSETTYALSNKKRVLIFLEEGIKNLGIIPKDYEYISFNKEKIEKEDKKYIRKLNENIKNYVKSIYKELNEGGIGSNYEVIENICRISVYNDGHGIEDVEVTLKTLSDNFEKRLHEFWLEDSANKDINLISLREKLKNLDLSFASKKRFSEQTFYARVLEPKFIDVSKIKDEGREEDKISFNLIFKSKDGSQIPADTKIKYAWGWSSPKAFPFKKEQLSDGSLKKNVNYASYTWEATSEYNLTIIVNFESGYNIEEGPFVEVFDREWQKIQRVDYSKIEEKLYYTTYYFKIGKTKPNHKFVVKWRPC